MIRFTNRQLLSCFFLLISTQLASAETLPIGHPIKGFCTRDLNDWGRPSQCGCPNLGDIRYDHRVNLCFTKLPAFIKKDYKGKLEQVENRWFLDTENSRYEIYLNRITKRHFDQKKPKEANLQGESFINLRQAGQKSLIVTAVSSLESD